MEPTSIAIGIASFLCFLLIAIEEIPWSFNMKRLERRLRRTSRRAGTTQLEALSALRVQTRFGAWVLIGFSIISLIFTVAQTVRDDALAPEFLMIAGSMVAGMFVLSLAFLLLAPKLFDAVAERVATESATTNSHWPNAEPSHGPRP